MVVLAKKAPDLDQARKLLEEALESGKALAKFREIDLNQGAMTIVLWIIHNPC